MKDNKFNRIFKSPKFNYLAKNSFLFALGSFGSNLLSFFLIPLYTNILSTEDYGNADFLTVTASLLVYVFSLNISDAILRFSIEDDKNKIGILKYGLKIVFCGAVVSGACITIFYVLHLVSWPYYFYVFLFLYILTNSLYSVFTCYLQSINKVACVSIAGILLTLFTIVSNIITLIVFEWRLLGYLFSLVFGQLIAIIYEIIQAKCICEIILKEECCKATKVAMIKFSIPLIFNGIGWWINSSIDRFFIILFCGVNVNGLYAAASKIPSVLSTVFAVFTRAWGLSSIKEFDPDDKDGFFSDTYNVFNSVLIVLCSYMIFINAFLARILFSKDFYQAWCYSSILVIASIFSSLSGFLGGIFSAVKRNNIFTVSTLSAALINCIFNFVFIKYLFAIGTAISTVISFFVVWIIRLYYSKKYIKLKTNLVADLILYFLVVIQSVLDHATNHLYVAQIVIVILVTLYNVNRIMKIVKMRTS